MKETKDNSNKLEGVEIYTDNSDAPFAQWMARHGAKVESGVPSGAEVAVFVRELAKRGHLALLLAFRKSHTVTYGDGLLIVEFQADDADAQRMREGADIFSDIGEKLLGRPVKLEVMITEPELHCRKCGKSANENWFTYGVDHYGVCDECKVYWLMAVNKTGNKLDDEMEELKRAKFVFENYEELEPKPSAMLTQRQIEVYQRGA